MPLSCVGLLTGLPVLLLLPCAGAVTLTVPTPTANTSEGDNSNSSQHNLTSSFSPLTSPSSGSLPTDSSPSTDAGPTTDGMLGTAEDHQPPSLWQGVGVGAGGMAGLVAVTVVVMVVVVWRRGWKLPCDVREPAPTPAAPEAEAAESAVNTYDGLTHQSQPSPAAQVYEAISDSNGKGAVYENTPTSVRAPTTQPPRTEHMASPDTKDTSGEEVEGEEVEGAHSVYVNYTPSVPRRAPGHADPMHVQPSSSTPAPLPPQHFPPDTATPPPGPEEDNVYMDMRKPMTPTASRTKL